MSIQNPNPEKCQEVRERELASFSVLKKTESQTWERNGVKKTESKSSWTLFFPMPVTLFLQSTEIGVFSHVWDSVSSEH